MRGRHGTREAFGKGCRCRACQDWFRLWRGHLLSRPLALDVTVAGRPYRREWPAVEE